MRIAKHGGWSYSSPRVCSVTAIIVSRQPQPLSLSRGTADLRRHVPVSHLPQHPPVPTREHWRSVQLVLPSRIPAPAHRVHTLGAAPDPARRSNGPWPHVTTGQLALPSNIAILIIRPLTRPALCRLSIKSDRVVPAWVPGAHREADWGRCLVHIDTIRARRGTTTPNLPAKGYLCSANKCCGSCLTSARA
jgi:hypothetical protein